MSKVSCEAAGKHRRCDYANGAAERIAFERINLEELHEKIFTL